MRIPCLFNPTSCINDNFYDYNNYVMYVLSPGRIKSGKKSAGGQLSKETTQSSGFYKPNSIVSDTKMPRSSTLLTHQSKSLTPIAKERTMDSFPESTDYYSIYEKPKPPPTNKLVMNKEKRAEILAKKHFVKHDWNFSPQCKLLGHYQQGLTDCYPRDPVTRLPHRDAAPPYLATHKNVPISAFSDADAHKRERRVIFQPETILDAPTKVKYSEDVLQTKPQVFLNLCNDLGSQMFQSKSL